MDKKHIKGLLDLMENSSLTALEIEEGEFRIRMERSLAQPAQIYSMPNGGMQMAQPYFEQSSQPTVQQVDKAVQSVDGGVIDLNNVNVIKSPMVGIFYAASKPGAEPYAKRGTRVKKGDVVCIIEAMKLMNEILSECDGEIVDICVENGQMVEFGQTLFKVY